jgi:hypothetical protein
MGMSEAGLAAVTFPVALPAQRCTALNHCTAKVLASREAAPCSCSVATRGPVRQAQNRRRSYFDMPPTKHALRASKEIHQLVAGSNATGSWTGMTIPAFTINFTSRNSSQSHTRPLSTPNRTVAVPHCCWSAGEGLTSRDDGDGK